MKRIVIILSYFFSIIFSYAQNTGLDNSGLNKTTFPSDKKVIVTPKLSIKGKKKTNIKLDNGLNKTKSFSMEDDSGLVTNNGAFNKRIEGLNKSIEPDRGSQEDVYLGDFNVKGNYVSIECRDFGEVDGDRVRIEVNGVVVKANLFLYSHFKGVVVDLKPGFNQINFIALNQGESGPNTAEFKVYNDKGIVVHHNQWNLATGVKASVIVVRDQ